MKKNKVKYNLDNSIQELINSNVPTCLENQEVSNVKSYLDNRYSEFDNIDYVYIVNDVNILKGVLSIKEFLSAPNSEIVSDLIKKELITINKDTNMKEAVYIAFSNGFKNIPVVDKDGIFLGVVSHDDLLNIFNKEMKKNLLTFGGVFHKVGEEYTTTHSSAIHMIKSRLPWLIIGVMGGIATASLVAHFENLLSSFIALASFIPIMVYMSDAAGTQSEALIIRAMALNSNLNLKFYLLREIKVACVISLASGLFAGTLALITRGNILLGAIIALSMFLSILASVFIATISPAIFKKK